MRPIRLNDRQRSAIERCRKNGGAEYLSPDLARQLVRKGLATLTGRKYQKTEWQRPVVGATVWEVRLKPPENS